MREARGSGFGQRIDVYDLAAAPLGVEQCRQHARMIGAWILPDDENRVAQIEIFERHGSLAEAERFFHARAAGFVTHVRAVRQVVGPKLPREQLVKKSRFVAGTARRVKDRFIGR